MRVEFDPRKSASNLSKHGVSFEEAEVVFYDPLALTREDDDSMDEARFVTVGLGAMGRLLTTVWTMRGEHVRLISAREATSNERRAYED
ncbi:MAG: BrnT family toxin [Sulfuricella sp.]|nr:BrnT family toxin [Sulfuricella sp.]